MTNAALRQTVNDYDLLDTAGQALFDSNWSTPTLRYELHAMITIYVDDELDAELDGMVRLHVVESIRGLGYTLGTINDRKS